MWRKCPEEFLLNIIKRCDMTKALNRYTENITYARGRNKLCSVWGTCCKAWKMEWCPYRDGIMTRCSVCIHCFQQHLTWNTLNATCSWFPWRCRWLRRAIFNIIYQGGLVTWKSLSNYSTIFCYTEDDLNFILSCICGSCLPQIYLHTEHIPI